MKPRITVANTLYFQEANADAIGFPGSFERELSSDEQVYIRRFQLESAEPVPLDCGWIKEAGQLQLMVDRKQYFAIPEKEVRAADDAVRVIVAVAGIDFAALRPGESMHLEPVNMDKYTLRAPFGAAKCRLALVPV